MSMTIAARGAQGAIVRRIQEALAASGSEPGPADGDFGPKTQAAVERFQADLGLTRNGEVDIPTWRALIGEDPPPARDLCLQLTAAFEGHGFSLARGNFDGAGLTWGIIGFTLKHGDIGKIVRAVDAAHPGLLEEAFGSRAAELRDVIRRPRSERVAWADSISTGARKTGLRRPWREGFRRFGEMPEVQAEQLRLADERYFQPAVHTARAQMLASELGLALCFDIHVQNGGIKRAARRRIDELLATHPVRSERDRRVLIANAVADASSPRWREDVRSRKQTIATGAGTVHARMYLLRNWGLGECPVTV